MHGVSRTTWHCKGSRHACLVAGAKDAVCGFAGPGSHWCENVGRAHKSNHVFFVVALAEGRYAQKCHDPECAHFRSAWMPLPEQLRLRRV